MVLPLLWDYEHEVKISGEKLTCYKLLSKAVIGAQSPLPFSLQAQLLSQCLLDCEEQLGNREQEDGGILVKPQSSVKQLRCER